MWLRNRPRPNLGCFLEKPLEIMGQTSYLIQRCAWKPGGSSLAPYYEGIFRYPSSLAPFQAPASDYQLLAGVQPSKNCMFAPHLSLQILEMTRAQHSIHGIHRSFRITGVLLLMLQKSDHHHLGCIFYLLSINNGIKLLPSTGAGFLKHQQWHTKLWCFSLSCWSQTSQFQTFRKNSTYPLVN